MQAFFRRKLAHTGPDGSPPPSEAPRKTPLTPRRCRHRCILITQQARLHNVGMAGPTPFASYRWCPGYDTPLASARGRCLVVVGRRLHALGLLWVHPVTRSNNRASTRWYSSPPVRWLRHTAPRCTPLSRHNERDTTQRTPSRTRGEGAGSTRLRNGACRAPNEWKPYRVWEPQGSPHEHP